MAGWLAVDRALVQMCLTEPIATGTMEFSDILTSKTCIAALQCSLLYGCICGVYTIFFAVISSIYSHLWPMPFELLPAT